jgi:hypothetical protein
VRKEFYKENFSVIEGSAKEQMLEILKPEEK